MRVAHISDLHATATKAFQHRFRALLNSIRRHRVDHVVITGDVTDKGREEDYDTALQLLDESGFADESNLTVIPGNHDVFPTVYQSFTFRLSTLRVELRENPVRISRELYRVVRAYRNFSPQQYEHALRYFVHRFEHTFKNTVAIGTQETAGFPRIKILNDQYAAICVDSNYVSPRLKMPIPFALLKYLITRDLFSVTDSPICSNGWVDITLLRRALSSPTLRGKRILILMHHYVYSPEYVRRYMGQDFERSMAVVNLQELVDELRNSRVEYLLHGHWHQTEEYSLCDNRLRVANGAGVFRNDGGTWNLLSLTPAGISREAIMLP